MSMYNFQEINNTIDASLMGDSMNNEKDQQIDKHHICTRPFFSDKFIGLCFVIAGITGLIFINTVDYQNIQTQWSGDAVYLAWIVLLTLFLIVIIYGLFIFLHKNEYQDSPALKKSMTLQNTVMVGLLILIAIITVAALFASGKGAPLLIKKLTFLRDSLTSLFVALMALYIFDLGLLPGGKTRDK